MLRHFTQNKVTRWINRIAAGIYQNITKIKKKIHADLPVLETGAAIVFRKYHRIFYYHADFCCSLLSGGFFRKNDEGFTGCFG